jgi:hypothetical protein
MRPEIRRMGRALLEAEVVRFRALLPVKVGKEAYRVEPLAVGWFCPDPACGVFNGDAKVFLTACRACGSERPHA